MLYLLLVLYYLYYDTISYSYYSYFNNFNYCYSCCYNSYCYYYSITFRYIFITFSYRLLLITLAIILSIISFAASLIIHLLSLTTAVDARLVSPAALIVTASAGICGFTLPSRDLSDAVRIWRFALAILAGAGGLFALTAGGIALLIHLSGLTSLDVSYLAPFSDARARRAVLRPLLVRQKWRDTALHPQDLKNQGDGHAQ